MPLWLVFVLMVLTAYRLTRLVVKDTFPPVLWLRDKLAGGWRPLTEPEQRLLQDPDVRNNPRVRDWRFLESEDGAVTQRWVERKRWSPYWLAELISCPWCASAYVSGAVVAVTDVTVGLPVPVLLGFAVWAGAALLASQEWA